MGVGVLDLSQDLGTHRAQGEGEGGVGEPPRTPLYRSHHAPKVPPWRSHAGSF
jgi:hypothetical protein